MLLHSRSALHVSEDGVNGVLGDLSGVHVSWIYHGATQRLAFQAFNVDIRKYHASCKRDKSDRQRII
jgi:hypothetical protein